MKNKPFSAGLYLDGLRKTRMATVVSCVLSAIGVFLPVYLETKGTGLLHYRAEEFLGFAPLLFLVVAPILTSNLFSFLNKRGASDFYHSLPHTRLCVFTSYAASLATQYFVIGASTFLSAELTLLIYKSRIYYTVFSIPRYLAACFIGALLTTAAMLIAKSFSGRLLYSWLFSLMILFAPRAFICVLDIVYDSLVSSFFPLADVNCNIVVSTVFGFRFFSDRYYFTAGSMIYTAVLALIYFVFAALLFCKRKSELAGAPHPTGKLQAILRLAFLCTPTFIISAVASQRLSEVFVFDNYISSEQARTMLRDFFIAYALCVIGTPVYELVTAKRWKSLKNVPMTVLMAAVLNIALIASCVGLRYIDEKYVGSPVEVTSVVIDNTQNIGSGNSTISYTYLIKTDDIVISDETVNKGIMASMTNSSEAKLFKYSGAYVKLNGGPFSRFDYRMIPERAYYLLRNTDEYRIRLRELPEMCENCISVFNGWRYSSFTDGDTVNKIRDTLYEEMQTVDIDEWSLLQQKNQERNQDRYIIFPVRLNGKYVYARVAISDTLTPQTMKTINEAVKASANDAPEYIYFSDMSYGGTVVASYY